jgi:peptidoglycan/xylan/chitin deacetylase (PgdA/CDA1 family)
MKRTIYKIIRYSGLPFLFKEIIQRNKTTILLFHDIDVETAKNIFSYLKKNYSIIGLVDFLKAVSENKQLPKKSLILTFDDGNIGNYYLLPIIKDYDIPITVFLCASVINTNRHFWFNYSPLNLPTRKLNSLTNNQRITILAQTGFNQEKEYEEPQALQWTQINEMRQYVDFQSHTLFHPNLPQCNDHEAEKEISKSKEILENEYGFDVYAIAYPNGDYSEREIWLSKKTGYKCGITVDYGFNTVKTDLFKLKRISVNDTSDLNELIVKSSGVWGFLKLITGQGQNYKIRNFLRP